MLLAASCSREPAAPPPAPAAAPAPAPPEPPEFRDAAFRIVGDSRSPSGWACWVCYQDTRDSLESTPGVKDVTLYPDAGIIVVRMLMKDVADAAGLVPAIRRAMPAAGVEPQGEPEPVSRPMRLTRELPRVLRGAFVEASEERPLIVIKCVAAACARCDAPEPDEWGDEVVRVDVDLETNPEAGPCLAPEAVPEWICFDRQGNELGRWRGRIDPRRFQDQLAGMVAAAR